MKLKIVDYPVIFLSLLVVVGVSWYAYGYRGTPGTVEITAEAGEYVYNLEEEEELLIPGPLGDTKITIRGQQVHVHDSPCRDKLCINMGSISRSGEWIACLPNKVFITIKKSDTESEENSVDVTTY